MPGAAGVGMQPPAYEVWAEERGCASNFTAPDD
jgi:hypothetical protein